MDDNDDLARAQQWEKDRAERMEKDRTEQNIRYGMQLAARFFEKRGKGKKLVEVHISETDLGALLAMAFGHGREMPR